MDKSEKFLYEKKKTKKKKKLQNEHMLSSTYNVEISNSFNPELELKDNESATKSKLIKLLTQLRGFKFMTTLVLVFKKI